MYLISDWVGRTPDPEHLALPPELRRRRSVQAVFGKFHGSLTIQDYMVFQGVFESFPGVLQTDQAWSVHPAAAVTEVGAGLGERARSCSWSTDHSLAERAVCGP